MDNSQYLSMFIDESNEHLQALNEHLLTLEQSPDDISIVQHIFRSAHTLKGMAGSMGFEDLSALTHEMENVLDLVRNEKLSMSERIFETLFKSLDALEAMVQDIVEGGSGKLDVSEIVAVLNAIFTGKDVPEGSRSISVASSTSLDQYQLSVLNQSLETGFKVQFIEVVLRDDCVLKGARAYMVFDLLQGNGEIIKSWPSVEELEQENFEKSFSLYFVTKQETEKIEEFVMSVSEIDRVDISNLDKESLQRAAEVKQAEKETAAASAASTSSKTKPAGGGTSKAPVVSKTIRVDIERLDTLMNLFSELLIDRVRLEQLSGEINNLSLNDTIEHLSRVSSDLQNIVLNLRMVPVESVFNRFPRMIRDISRSLNKKVNLVISGAETELDRTVIDEIGDPLVHLLRNAVDHGLETTQDRIKAEKSEIGTIHLRAYHSGNHVYIEVEDDGKGINREGVLKKAIANEVVSEEESKQMTDEEVHHLLFASGFSTADQISDISGRGVGLDVVLTKITSLGGNIVIESNHGIGTKFVVQLPLTLSIISAMLIRIREEKFAIPLSSILETAIVPKQRVKLVQGNKVMEYRDSIIPIIALGDVLDVPDQETDQTDEYNVLILQKGDKLLAAIVDEFLGQQEIVLKTLGEYLNRVFAVSGATILGDGRVSLIIDSNALFLSK